MKMLVFGNSDTRGAVVAGPTWPERVRQALAASDESVELVDRGFVPLGREAPAYALKLVDEVQPDIVLLPLSEYTFWAVSVELQIRHRLGDKAAARFKAAERRLDGIARGKRGVLGAGHHLMQQLARRAIGVRAPATATEVAQVYVEVLRGLARREAIQVVLVSYPLSPLPALRSEKVRRSRALFRDRVRATAEKHRMHWADGDEIVARAGLAPEDAYADDGIHIGEPAHPLYAAEILRLISTVETRPPGVR